MVEDERREDRPAGDEPQEAAQPPAGDEREQRRAEALARASQRRREREGAVQKAYPPSPLEPAVRSALESLTSDLSSSLDELVVRTPAERLVEVCRTLKETPGLEFAYLRCLSVVDYVEDLEVLYHISSLGHAHKVVVKVRAAAAEPRIPTVTPVWRGADWHEREGHDLFGVLFEGHPDMSPLLLYEGFEGFPLRKSYEIPEQQEILGG